MSTLLLGEGSTVHDLIGRGQLEIRLGAFLDPALYAFPWLILIYTLLLL